jgi:hypothetical protein
MEVWNLILNLTSVKITKGYNMKIPKELAVKMIILSRCNFTQEELNKMPGYQLENIYYKWVQMEEIKVID